MAVWLQRSLLIMIVSLLGWQAVTLGNGQIITEHLTASYDPRWTPLPNALEQVAVDDNSILTSDAWSSLAEQAFAAGDISAAEAYALRGINKNLSSGRAASQLIRVYGQRDNLERANLERADKLADLTDRLWPVHSNVQLILASHWLRSPADVEKGLKAMNILLSRTSLYNERLFPPMHTLLQDEEGEKMLLQYAQKAPTWWPSFFAYLAQHETKLDTLTQYYQARTQSEKPLLKNEQIPYINRLIKDKHWQQAHQIWQETLNPAQKKVAGHPYDGGFESELHNEGFAWHFKSTPLVTVALSFTGGITGKQALHIAFKNQKQPINFQQVWQQLTLPPGEHTLSLRYRLDDLDTRKGLQWRIRCDNKSNAILGESQPMKGRTDNWKTLSINFNIPSTGSNPPPPCAAQMLRLEAVSQYAHDQLFKGGLWFDDITIQKGGKP